MRTSPVGQLMLHGPFWLARLKLDEPKDDAAVALAGTAHGPHPVHDGRLDLLDEASTAVTLLRPSR
jgi:hypothetical protein